MEMAAESTLTLAPPAAINADADALAPLPARAAGAPAFGLDLVASTRSFGTRNTSTLPAGAVLDELTRASALLGLTLQPVAGTHKLMVYSRAGTSADARVVAAAAAVVTGRGRRESFAPLLPIGSELPGSTPPPTPRMLNGGGDGGDELMWEMEVCLLPRLDLRGIKLRRIAGDIWSYKRQIEALFSVAKL
jgi:hypothetical protein